MTTLLFECDLGFDGSQPGDLQINMVDTTSNTVVPLTQMPEITTDTQLQIVFRLFDISPVNGEPAVQATAISFGMSLLDFDSNTAVTPLSPISAYTESIDPSTAEQGTSVAYSPETPLTFYPVHTFDVDDIGHFNLIISVTVTKQGGATLIYFGDPEMIVGGSEGGGPTEDGEKKIPGRAPQPERPAMNL